jgi:hypothetical protein
VQYMLSLLKSRSNLSNNPATVIAQIVSALKTMSQNLNYGDQVLHILNSDPIWAEFKDQDHSLFITDSQKRLCIQGEFLLCEILIFKLIFELNKIRLSESSGWLFDTSAKPKHRSVDVATSHGPK